MPLTYRQVKDIHDEMLRAGAVTKSLPEWSAEMDRLSESNLYSAGLSDNFIKQTSVNIDRMLEATGLPQATGQFGRQVGEMVGRPEYGQELGQTLPRAAVNFLPMFIPGVGPVAAGAATAALSGAEAYTATDSPAAGFLAGGMNVAMPGVARAAEQGALRALGVAPIAGRVPVESISDVMAGGATRAVSERIPTTLTEGITSQVAGQAAAGVLGVGSELGQQALAGQPLRVDPLEQLLNLTLGQVPFAGLYATKGGLAQLGGETSRARAAELKHATETTENILNFRRRQEEIKKKTPLEQIPEPIGETLSPAKLGELNSRLSQLYTQQQTLKAEGSPLTEDEWNSTSREINDLLRQNQGAARAETLMGTKLDGKTERMVLKGEEIRTNAAGTGRLVRVADLDENGPWAGKEIWYSTLHEPKVGPGEFSIPLGFVTESKWTKGPVVPRVEGQPELPIQAEPGEINFDFQHVLNEAEQDLAAAQTVSDYRLAAQKLNAVREAHDFAPYTDLQLAARMQKLKLKSEKDAVQSAISETKRLLQERQDRKAAEAASRVEDVAYAADVETRRQAGDPVAQQVHELRQTFQDLGGRYDEVVSQGMFDKAAKEWEASGSKDIEDLKARFPSAISQGKGLKARPKEGVSVPLMITKKMEADLRTKGFTQEQINKMTPQVAHEHLTAETEKPPPTPEVKADLDEVAAVSAASKDHSREALPLVETVKTRANDLAHKITEPTDQNEYMHAVEEGDFQRAIEIAADYGLHLDITRMSPVTAPVRSLSSRALQVQAQLGTTGLSTWNYLSRPDADPELRMLMRDLSKFSGSLERIDVEIIPKGRAFANAVPGRRARLFIGEHLLVADPAKRDWIITHELVHGLTMNELANPTNERIRGQFADLRIAAVAALPKAIRNLYNDARTNDFYGRWARGNAKMFELGTSTEWQNIIYGLLNDDEFIAQGFSSKPFQDFLKSQKTSTGESYFHRFINWIKETLGLQHIDNTLFEQFLSYSDQVLAQNNYIARIHNYGERYLEQGGVEPELATAQTDRALGLLQQNTDPVVTPEALLLTAMQQPSMSGTVDRATMQYSSMSPDDVTMMNMVFGELGYEQQGVDGLLYEASMGFDIGPLLDVIPEAASNYLFERTRDIHQVVDVLRAMTRDKIAGRLDIATPDRIAKPAEELTKQLERIMALEESHNAKIREVQKVANVAPAAFLDAIRAEVPQVVRHALLEGDETAASTVMERALEKPAQFARRHPQVAEFVSKGYQLLANSRTMAAEGFKAFGIDLNTNSNTTEAIAKFIKALGNQKIVKAVDRWMYWNNKKGGDKVMTLPVTDPDVARELQGLTTEERQTAIDTIYKKEASQVFMNAQILEKMANISAVNAATLIQPRTGLKSSQNLALTDALMSVLILPPDVLATDRAHNAKLALVQSKLAPEVFLDLLKFAQGEGEKWRTYKEFFDANPGWSSAQRFGKFDLVYRRGGKTYRDAVDSKREAQEVARGGQIVSLERRSRETDDSSPHIGSDFQGIIERLRILESNQTDILRTIGMSPEDIADVQKYSPVEQMAFETQYGRGVPVPDVRVRRLTLGAEELPWLTNHFSWVHKSSTFWSRQLYRAQARLLRGDPELVERPDLRQWTQQHAHNILAPDPEFARVASKFTTTWLMGFNVASAMANGTQLLNRGVAELTSITGKPLDSYKRMGAVTREIIDWAKTGRWANEEHKWLVEKLNHDGEATLSLYDDEAGLNESVTTNFKRATVRGKPHTLAQWLTDAAGTYTVSSMWLFRNVERFNNIGASMAAFDLYRGQGFSRDEAYVKATEFNHAVNDVGGRVNRSVGLFSGKDDFSRSGAMLANSMQSYVLGSTWQMINYLKSGWFRPQGLKPHEVYAARKAAIQMLSTQFVMAGALGMPFVSGAIALLDSQFQELELNRRLREFVASIFDDDEGNANILGDIALTGAPSMMGWDWQSRLSMGNTVPGVSEINGFQPELLLGAPVNVISQFVKGAYKTASGQGGFVGVDKGMMPPFLRKILDTIQVATSGGTQLKDSKDRPVYDPTLGESIGLAFGFQPKGLSDQNAVARIARQAGEVSKAEIGQFHGSVADEVLRGNFGTAQQALLDRAQRDGLYNPREGVQAVARAAEEMTFVRDLRNEGTSRTAQTRSKLLSAFNLEKNATSEMARFQFRQLVEQRLGLPPSAQSSHELLVAQMVDQLRAARPEATRVELRRAAEAALRGPRKRSLSPVSL